MSERPPTSAGRLDNWTKNQEKNEINKWENAIYADAGRDDGTGDFSEEAFQRVQEGDAYEKHMAALSVRSADHDTINEDRFDAIDRTIQGDVKLRNMAMQANLIRELAERKLDGSEDADRLANQLEDKENRLQELLEDYMENGAASEHEKDEIMTRIIDMTRKHSVGVEEAGENSPTETVDNSGENESEADSEQELESDNQEGQDAEVAQEADEPRMTKEELSAKRVAMVKSGLTGLVVGNMSDSEIEAYNLVESEAATEIEYPEDDESGIDGGEQNSEDGGSYEDQTDENEASDNEEEINTDWVDEYEDGEEELLVDTRGWAARHWADLRNNGISAYAGGQMGGFKMWLDNRRNPNYEETRDRRGLMALGLVALTAATAAWALYKSTKGFDSGSGQPGGGLGGGLEGLNDTDITTEGDAGVDSGSSTEQNDSETGGAGSDTDNESEGNDSEVAVTPELLGADFNVESGNGYTHELQDWAQANGQKLSPENSYKLYEHLRGEFGDAFLTMDSGATPTYLHGNEVRLNLPGKATWSEGVMESAHKWMSSRGLWK